ncbi:MAG: sigma-70 family RNA polymerase sigma factor [Clostridia bacterium]|nr:sigma-70 family RNA polymerase sigma factor [Clostridia bacterium]MBQ8370643.1 sigma-70 family RNA polymerase sigma factor [Clostridia bacterium]MBQ8512371.1 sigma-70 family RNA polymerase sigma factor [Clostridia bacterium]
MKNTYKLKMTKKLLSEWKLRESSLEYCAHLSNLADLPEEKAKNVKQRLLHESRTFQTLENAIRLLTPIERRVIDLHYRKEHSFEDIEIICRIARSSIYRHHARALEKIALVLFGE